MIIDAHAHAWERWPHAGPAPGYGVGTTDLLAEMDVCGVQTTALVAAALPAAPNNNSDVADAVVAHSGRLLHFVDADSRWSPEYHAPGAARRLRRLVARYRPTGVSHYLAANDDGWLSSAEAHGLFAVAAEHGLVVSLAAPPAWHAAVCRIAGEFVEVPILLNHLGGVESGTCGPEVALELIAAGKSLPNLLVKVSGPYYRHGAAAPYSEYMSVVRRFCEVWGAHRLVWGSDFPSCRAHLSYREALALVDAQASFLTEDEREGVLGGNFQRVLESAALVRHG